MSAPADHVLHVVMNGRVIGDVQRSGKRRLRLRYEDHDPDRFTPLSVSMPGPGGRHREGSLVPWLEGLLPDRPELLRRWRRSFGIADDTGPFALLRCVGEDVAGAAQFVRPERLETVLHAEGDLSEIDGTHIAEMLRRAKADLPVSPDGDARGKFSLAGAQAKIAVHRTEQGWSDPCGAIPSTHIIKPAIPGMFDQDLVEAVTLRAAAILGLRAARCVVQEFDDERAVVVTRHDRTLRPGGRWQRVHQEDMCQALTVWPAHKYESEGGPAASRIVDLLHRTSQRPEEDSRRFAQALIFNWLTCGTDGHARNYSLLLSGTQVRLAPLYDLNSYLAYSSGAGNDLSMSVGGTFRAAGISTDDWTRFAPTLRVDPRWIREEIRRQSEGVVDALIEASHSEDIARYDSPTVGRLISNSRSWIHQLMGPRT